MHAMSTRQLIAVFLLALIASTTATGTWATPPGAEPDIIFACRQPGKGSHWYENFGYQAFDTNEKLYGSYGRLCRLNTDTGQVETLLDDPQGAVRDPQVNYDGLKILISYRPGGTDHYHLYELNLADQQLTQLTSGPYDDIEPTYLPDGSIMFCSSRSNRWVNCWYSQVATLFRCDSDGQHIHPISANIEHDNTPWPLQDGRVIYLRWEYVDRSRVAFHHLWTANPDGTNQTVFYGNMHPDTVMIDAKPIPGRDSQVVAIFSPGHGKKEHMGRVTLVTSASGPDEPASVQPISQGDDYRDPFPVSPTRFLVAQGSRLLSMDRNGMTRELYRLPDELAALGVECHEPRPLVARAREPIIPPRIDRQATTGKLFLADVYQGRRMEGVKRNEIASLLVLETLPKPINYSGKMPPISYGGTYTLERVLGTVPVEPDGSALMQLPALRPLFFVALDKNGNSVKRMHSFLTVMPGETTSCVGCHEQRTQTPRMPSANSLALHRPVSKITPIEGIPEVFDYPRDIQPILDRHCVACHDYDQRAGGVILTGDRGPIYSHSYFTLTALQYVSDGRDRKRTNLPPRSVGTSASPLMDLVDGSHYGAKLSQLEQDQIRYWIESAAPYPGTYAALGTGMIGGFPRSKLETSDRDWPESVAAAAAIQRRCQSCHNRKRLWPLPRFLSDNLGLVLSNPDMNDSRIRHSRHLMFNLTRPEESLILLAPLALNAGGYELCSPGADKQGRRDGPVFADRSDPDYQLILALCRKGKTQLDSIKRFDMPGFRPTHSYVREMKRFGILPQSTPDDAVLDVYATDQAYWQSHWWRRSDGLQRPAP